jgi:predicted peptidase
VRTVEGDRCLILVPEGAGPHAVLCFLHGAGEAAADRDGKAQSLAKLRANGSPAWHAESGSAFVSRFLVVCPQLERRRRWENTDAPWVDSVVQAAVRDHTGDLSRLVLTGFSYGGEGAFQILAASKLVWPTLWAVDPALQRVPPLPAADVRVWVHHGSAQPGAQNMESFGKRLGLEPSSDMARRARRVLTALRTDHPDTCAAAYAQAHVYDWLLR